MDEWSGQGDVQGLLDAHRRIFADFEEIAAGTEALALAASMAPPGHPSPAEASEVDRLRAEIEEERMANAQLTERVRALREREAERHAGLAGELDRARAEVARLRAEREGERAEIDAVVAALAPLIAESA